MNKKTISTSTTSNNAEIVPWLASTGPLSYSPESPPDRDYFFQYTWIIPDIFNEKINKREHRYFGYPYKDHSEIQYLLDFWNNARNGVVDKVHYSLGSISKSGLFAPMAIYKHDNKNILIQHGSYQFIKDETQPELKDGIVYLYRGIGEEAMYKHFLIKDNSIYENIMNIHTKTLTDSVISFNTVHSNIKRCETSALNHDTFLLYDYADELNDPRRDEIVSILNSGYSLDYNYGCRKFGSHHVVFKTSLSNIRITTFFCGEAEVKIIDPNKLEVVNEVGCEVKEIIL
jgi:hypothetical protein